MSEFTPDQKDEIEKIANKNKKKNSSVSINEIIKIIPSLAWVGLAILVTSIIYHPFTDLLKKDRITKLSIASFSVEIAQAKGLDDQLIGRADLNALEERASRMSKKIQGARILWVDDGHPNRNILERSALEKLGIIIDTLKSTSDALEYLK